VAITGTLDNQSFLFLTLGGNSNLATN